MKEILICSLGVALLLCFVVVFIVIGNDFVDNFKVDDWGQVKQAAFGSFFISFFSIAFAEWIAERKSL